MKERAPQPSPLTPVKHIDIVFDGPPDHESGRFVEVEDHEGKSIAIGSWLDPAQHGKGNSSYVLRIEDPRDLRQRWTDRDAHAKSMSAQIAQMFDRGEEVDAVWALLDHRVDGQPFFSDCAANGGGEELKLAAAVTMVLDHYRDEIAKWKAAWGSNWSAEDNTPDKLERWRKEVEAQRESASNAIHDLEERTVSQAQEIRALRLRIERRDAEYDARLEEIENLKRAKSGSWNELTARAEKAERERDQLAAETLAWSKAAQHLDHTIIAPPQLKIAAERVSDELAAARVARVARDEWHAVARRLASKVQTPAEFSELLDTLQEGMRTGSRACVELEALRKEHDRARTLLDTLGRVLLGPNAGRPYAGHDIERAALETKRTADALPEAAKVLGIVNLTPHDLVERVTRLREAVDTRSKQLDDANDLAARFRKALVIRNSPKLDAAAELEEIRAIVLASLKRAEPVPTTPLITLVGELAGAHDAAIVDRDEMAQEMARSVHPEDVAQAISAVADGDDDEETDDDEITIGLDDACDILGDVLIEHVDDDAIEGIVDEFRSRWDDDANEPADEEPDEPAEVKISDEQIDTIVDRLAERLASTGSRVRVIKPRGR